MPTWPGGGKGLPLQGSVLCGDLALKAHGRVACPGGPCFAAVLEPFKWTMATWPGAGKGLPLQGNVLCGDLGRQWQSAKGPRGLRVLVDRASRRF